MKYPGVIEMELLDFLQKWYHQYCNGDWEHSFGIKIDTLDNPGWAVDIDLTGTDLEDKEFETVRTEKGGYDWLYCSVENNVFTGRGGPDNLKDILIVFFKWIIETEKEIDFFQK
jgi:hypothetical protein